MQTIVNKKIIAYLVLFHVAVIALANYAVQFTGTVVGYPFTWGMFVFPLVLLATDLTVRLLNQQHARIIVAIAYVPAIAISVWLAGGRIGLASGTAYLLGQLLDITVFQKIHAWRGLGKRWWLPPLVSTWCANMLDTYVFFSVAFYRSADTFMANHWVAIANADLGFKIVVSMLVFLPVYGVLLNALLRKPSA